MNNLLEAALRYAELGWHVFPIAPGGKTPITTHGVKDATTDTEQIKAWWAMWPDANIAVACGRASGIFVGDIDITSSEDINGIKSLREFDELPCTIKQITPRGGFHAFFKSLNPPANRNSFRPGIDIRGDGYYVVLAPSVRADGKRYTWEEGCSPWDRPLAEFPDFLRPTVKAPRVTPAATAQLVATQTAQHSDDTMRRASAYLAACEPAIQGQAGHDKLLYAASRMVHGFLLTDVQAYGILANEYNPRCVPPWDLTSQSDEKDFRRKVTEVRKLQPQHEPGWLINDSDYSSGNFSGESCVVDIPALLHKAEYSSGGFQFQRNESPLERTGSKGVTMEVREVELRFLCQPTGLLGEMCAWLNTTSLRQQPFLSLAASLTFLGALFGRKIKDELGSRTNLYCMGVAPSSAGKQHALNQIRNLCAATGCVELLGGDYIASDSAIEERISRSPVTLFLWDEIGHLLAHIRSGASRNHAQVVSLLMKLYSSAGSMYLGREYAEAERQRSVIQPCCCIYGTSTPERFTSGISPEELQDGWLSRCLVFHSGSNPPKNRNADFSARIPESITRQVQAWNDFAVEREAGSELLKYVTPGYCEAPPEQRLVSSLRDAEKVFISFDNESSGYGRKHPLLACLWGKGEENARRIALIVAAGDSFDNPVITRAIANYACRLVRYLLISFGEEIAPEIVSSEAERSKRKIYRVIKATGTRGITMQHLTRATRWSNQKGRRDMLNDLIAAGDITVNPNSKMLRYWTPESYVKYLEGEN